MTSVEFLKSELEVIACKFPNVHIKYGYNSIIETHVVELLPLIEYLKNSELDKAWIPVSLKFMELFQDEEVTFISSDSSLSLKEVIFEFNIYPYAEENLISELYEPLTKLIFNYSFPTEIPDGKIIGKPLIHFSNESIEDKNFDKNSIEYSTNSYLAAA